MEDNYFAIMWWFLPYINMNWPQVCVCLPPSSWTPLPPNIHFQRVWVLKHLIKSTNLISYTVMVFHPIWIIGKCQVGSQTSFPSTEILGSWCKAQVFDSFQGSTVSPIAARLIAFLLDYFLQFPEKLRSLVRNVITAIECSPLTKEHFRDVYRIGHHWHSLLWG